MEIKIGHMDKRINSTKHKVEEWTTPDGYVDVKLKEPTTLDEPVFILLKKHYKIDEQGQSVLVYELDPKKDNYVYVDEWKSYYWVDHVEYRTNDIIALHCHRDVLATGIELLKKKMLLQYCSDESKAKRDFMLSDPRFAPDRPPLLKQIDFGTDVDTTIAKNDIMSDPQTGTYIIRCLAKDKGLIAYAFTKTQFESFYEEFTGASGLSSVDDFLAKTFGDNWRNCFASAYFIPIDVDSVAAVFDDTTSDVYIGTLQLNNVGSDIPCTTEGVAYISRSGRFKVKVDDDYQNLVDKVKFLYGSTFTKLEFDYPGGSIDISDDRFIEKPYIYFEESLDVMSGEYTINFYTCTGKETYSVKEKLIGKVGTKLGADVTDLFQRQSSSEYWTDVGAKAVRALPAIATGNAAAAVTGIAGAFTSASLGANAHSCYVGGGLTNFYRKNSVTDYWDTDHFVLNVSLNLPEILYEKVSGDASFRYDEYCKVHGYFVNDWIDLDELKEGTYVQAVGASVGDIESEAALSPGELATINSLLAAGIYLEDWKEEEPGG